MVAGGVGRTSCQTWCLGGRDPVHRLEDLHVWHLRLSVLLQESVNRNVSLHILASFLFLPGNLTLDDLKKWISELEVPKDNNAPPPFAGKKIRDVIPLGHWGFHSKMRSTPYNRPIKASTSQDMPLTFSWHRWSASYEEHGEDWENALWRWRAHGGTWIWLNCSSQLKPPIRLVDHQSRLVVNGPLQVVGLDCVPRWDLLSHVCVDPTWWPIPLTKWVITQVTSGLTLLVPLITRVIRDLLSGVNRQAKNFKTVDFIGEVRLFRATHLIPLFFG